jgi:hypothetical protein
MGVFFAWLILVGWGAQMASGALFGLISLYYYGETPDLSHIAMTALAVKIAGGDQRIRAGRHIPSAR